MDTDKFFSKDADNLVPSPIREAFKLIEKSGIISFAGGMPDPATFPAVEIKRAVDSLDLSKALQYGSSPGMIEFREKLPDFAKMRGIKDLSTDNVTVTTGSQEALYILSFLLINPGDDVIVEYPTYIATLDAMVLRRPVFHGIPLQEDGMDVVLLERTLKNLKRKGKKAKLIYTIPCSHNPTGVTMSTDKRKRLLELASEYDTLILEDDAYGLLSFDRNAPDSIKSMDKEERVIYTSSFSKILSPGFRIGWVAAEKTISRKIDIMKQSVDMHTPTFNQSIALELLKNGTIERNLPAIRERYKKKRDSMTEAIEENFPKSVTFTRPSGGMFIFAWLDKKINATDLLPKAIENGVAYVPGEDFFFDRKPKNTMRLNFSFPSQEQIYEGIKRLSRIL